MQFLFPSVLWALLALLIPIIIHLFYFRRFKKVYFTNVKYLKEVKEETSSRSKLKNLLVLLSRLLAMALLILAFAQPFIAKNEAIQKGAKAVSIFVDNSFSMGALSSDVPLIDIAKDRAREIVNAMSEQDQFQVLTHDLEAKHQRLVSKEDALSYIDEIQSTPEVSTLDKVLERQKQVLERTTHHQHIYHISDFQVNIAEFDPKLDTAVQYNMLPLQAVQEKNVSIDSAWFVAPVPILNQVNKMIIKMSNYSDSRSENIQLSMLHEGQTRPLGTKSIEPNSSAYDTVNLSILRTGWHEAEIQISDYPVQFDDKYKVTFEVKEEVNVLSINAAGTNRYLNAAFGGLEYFKITNMLSNRLNYSTFREYDLIVLNDLSQISSGLASELMQYTENGGNILVFPGSSANIESYNNFYNQLSINNIIAGETVDRNVGTINSDEFIFSNVYINTRSNLKLPVTSYNYTMTNYQSKGEEVLLRYRDGKSYLSKYRKGNGHIYLCTAPLTDSRNDLVRNAEIFIPMLYKMALSTGKKRVIGRTIGVDQVIEADNMIEDNETVYRVVGQDEFIPRQLSIGSKVILDLDDQIKEEGFYELKLKDQSIEKLAYNYNRLESDLSYFSLDQLESKFANVANIIPSIDGANLQQYIAEKDHGIQLWKWCIILALIFLAIETLILRLWKT